MWSVWIDWDNQKQIYSQIMTYLLDKLSDVLKVALYSFFINWKVGNVSLRPKHICINILHAD